MHIARRLHSAHCSIAAPWRDTVVSVLWCRVAGTFIDEPRVEKRGFSYIECVGSCCSMNAMVCASSRQCS